MYDCCVMNKNKYVFAKSDTVYWQRKKEGKKKEEMEGEGGMERGKERKGGERGRLFEYSSTKFQVLSVDLVPYHLTPST